jgi:peptide/nickel transport system substrate-binding protein
MKNRSILAAILVLVFVCSAFAVMPAKNVSAAAAADDSKTLYVALQQDMPDFNYWSLPSNSVWKANVLNWAYETIAGLDFNMLPYPLLAESWTFYESNLTVNIKLREGVLFHDGTEMTADDVVFTYYAAREGTTIAANIINAFDWDGNGSVSQAEIEMSVIKTGDYSVQMIMASPYGQFFTTTLGIPIVPAHIWEDHLNAEGTFDIYWNDPRANIATGPYKYKEGEDNIYRVMEKFTDYWGKDFVTPYENKIIYPPNVDTIYFKIYASLDTAILALQAGAVDHIAWTVTPGRVPALQADPNIGLVYLEENGYYYLAFNEKFQPMNVLKFRQAVSHLIDKDQIVNVYMSGFGSKGSASEPPYWGEWYNESVETFPFDDPMDDTSTTSEDILDAAGFADVNGDGWRDLPDGSPMEKIILLTPPADYDPIRIRAGQMVAKNMREVGINAEAKAIDFDTLSARLQSMNYQMLMIGWSLSSEPVGNVFDILGPKSNQNTFGFWTVDDPNPFYKDLQGVNTLADAETQALAVKVDELAGLARGSFDVPTQILYTRWGEGVLAEALPCNVLYYKVNIEAYRNSWTGWTPFLGSLWSAGANIFNLAALERAGGGEPTGATGTVNAGISAPENVRVGTASNAYVLCVDDSGDAVAGATVTLSSEGRLGGANTLSMTPATGTSNADGVFAFTVQGTGVGYSYLNVTATLGTATSGDSTLVNAIGKLPKSLYATVTPDKLVLLPGETANVDLSVIDEAGAPVEGATLTIDENLMAYGSIDDVVLTTDADGLASTVYNAPTELVQMNAHETLSLSFAVVKAGYQFSNAPTANLVIYNEALPDWVMTKVESVGTTALNTASNSTTIIFGVMDDEGNPLPSHTVQFAYSNASVLVDPTPELASDADGNVTLTVMVKDGIDTMAFRVTAKDTTVPNSASATVTLTFVGATAPAETMYGGYITFAQEAQYIGPLGAVDATAWVWDHDGAPATDVNASMMLSATAYGSFLWSDEVFVWDTLWDYLGTAVVTTADNGNFVTSGPLASDFDYANWEAWYNNWVYFDWGMMLGVPIVDGAIDFTVYGMGVPPVDLVSQIYVVPGGYAYFNEVTSSYQVEGVTTIMVDEVIGKAISIVAPTFEIANPFLETLLTQDDNTTADVWVTDETNTLIEGATGVVYENGVRGNTDYSVYPSAGGSTDADGLTQAEIVASKMNGASQKLEVYVRADSEGALSVFQNTQIFIFAARSFTEIEAVEMPVAMGATDVAITATVTDWEGNPLEGIPVGLSADVGTVGTPTAVTDADGVATWVDVSAPSIYGAKAAWMTVSAKAGLAPYELSTGLAKLALQNEVSDIVMSLTVDGGTQAVAGGTTIEGGVNLTLTAVVTDGNGLKYVNISVDGGTKQAVVYPGVGAFADQVREISRFLGMLADGQHTVMIEATDDLGVSTSKTLTFTVETPGEEPVTAETDYVPWIVAAIGWILLVIVVVMLLMARKKGPAPMTPAEAEVEKEEA